MGFSQLMRLGAICGVILGVSVGVPGAVESFTGETTATSFIIGLGAAFGAPALTALHLRQQAESGAFGTVAYVANLIGLGLFAGVAFALNLVVFFLDENVAKDLLAGGPPKIALLGSVAVFIIGTVLFGVSMLRARVFPRIPVLLYLISLPLLAVLAALPDTLLTKAMHVLGATALIWLSLFTYQRAADRVVLSTP